MDELENYFWLNESLKIKKNETVSICNKGIKKKRGSLFICSINKV